MAVTLLTPSAYARYRKCDERAVRKAVLASRISTINGLIDPVVADIQWRANSLPRPEERSEAPKSGEGGIGQTLPFDAPTDPEKPPGEPDPGYQAHRARREAADAERAELETARYAGRLVNREEVESAVFDAFRSLRDRVLAVPRRCAPAVLGLVEVREIEFAIADELRRALGADEAVVAAIQAKVRA